MIGLSAYLWTVWVWPSEGRSLWRMARVTINESEMIPTTGTSTALSVVALYSKEIGQEAASKTNVRKRRRLSSESVEVEIIGMETEGIVIMIREDGVQAWDAEHGVLIEGAKADGLSKVKSGIRVCDGMLVGMVASGAELVAWRMEGQVGAEGGLRRIMGRLNENEALGEKAFKFNGGKNGWIRGDGAATMPVGIEGLLREVQAHQGKQNQEMIDVSAISLVEPATACDDLYFGLCFVMYVNRCRTKGSQRK